MAASCSVTGSFWPISVVTGTSVRSDFQVALQHLARQAAYCMGSGSLSRYLSRR